MRPCGEFSNRILPDASVHGVSDQEPPIAVLNVDGCYCMISRLAAVRRGSVDAVTRDLAEPACERAGAFRDGREAEVRG